MAYMSQENKARIVALCKPILAKYKVKATFSVDNHSTVICTIKTGGLFTEPYHYYINEYAIERNFEGIQRDFLVELRDAMMDGNHNNSDIMTDYFDVGWYISIRIS